MKPKKQQIVDAVAAFQCLAMFPSAPAAHEAVMRLLDRMVNTAEELDWLVRTMLDEVGVWKGPAELRGVFCAFGVRTGAVLRGWRGPADGVWHAAESDGFTQEDRNALFTKLESEQHAAFLPAGAPAAGELATAGEMKLLPLPPEEIAENGRLLRKIEHAACPGRAFKSIPPPTDEDRAASQRLLGILENLG